MKVLITGCAGYVGSILTTALAERDDVAEIVGLDLRPRPERLRDVGGKLRWVQADTADDGWRAALAGGGIDAVIHCAYHTREPYGAAHERQRRWNLDGARNVFEFALGEPSVRRIVQFSTVSVYGAQADNSQAARFTEDTPLAPADYLYSRQKQEVEAILRGLYERSDRTRHAIIIRPASLSGPYGRYVVDRFGGLVSTLTGRLPAIPVGRRDWCRQYLHEDDLTAIITLMLTTPRGPGLEVFNLSPEDALSSDGLAALYSKRVLVVPPLLLRAAFALIWHGTRGAFTTPPGAWRMLTYPIAVEGSRLTRVYGYRYGYSSVEALTAQKGAHAAAAVRSAAARPPLEEAEPAGARIGPAHRVGVERGRVTVQVATEVPRHLSPLNRRSSPILWTPTTRSGRCATAGDGCSNVPCPTTTCISCHGRRPRAGRTPTGPTASPSSATRGTGATSSWAAVRSAASC